MQEFGALMLHIFDVLSGCVAVRVPAARGRLRDGFPYFTTGTQNLVALAPSQTLHQRPAHARSGRIPMGVKHIARVREVFYDALRLR